MLQRRGPNASDVEWLIDFSARRSRAFWFLFRPLLRWFSASVQTTCFSAMKDFMIREKGWKKKSINCNQKLIRTNGGDLKKKRKKKKQFLGCVTCLNWQENSVICKSRGQQSDTSQLKFHYAANWVKSRLQPRIVKAFLLKKPGHDLSIQFRPWLTSDMRQPDSALCSPCPSIGVVVLLITSWYYNFTHAGNKHRNKHPESEFGTEMQLFCPLK